jgi:hypothetical protein
MSVITRLIASTSIAIGSLTISTPALALNDIFASYIPVRTGSNIRYEKIGVDNGSLFTIATTDGTSPGATAVRFSYVASGLTSLGILDADFFSVSTTRDNPALSIGGLLIQNIDSGSFSFTYRGTEPLVVGSNTYFTGANLLSGTYTNGSVFGTREGSSGSAIASTPIGVVTYTSDLLNFTDTTNKDFSLALTALTPFLTRVDAASSIGSFRAASAGVFSNELVASVPEPYVWGTMIVGFAMVGLQLRQRRGLVVTD